MSSNVPGIRRGTTTCQRVRSPGEVLRNDYMRPRRMTAPELAGLTCLPVSRIRGIMMGESIDVDCATRFAAVFCTTVLYWMVLQNDFDMARERRKHEYGGWGVL
jgi:addiction module HigA family antidote